MTITINAICSLKTDVSSAKRKRAMAFIPINVYLAMQIGLDGDSPDNLRFHTRQL